MLKHLLIAALITIHTTLSAQTARQEMSIDKRLSASSYAAYPSPAAQLTASPSGKKPFYISHYGRHGACYHAKIKNYDEPYRILAKADSLGQLTRKGQEVMRQLAQIRAEAMNRWHELTPIGMRQVRDIASRMVDRFPEVFEGSSYVSARSCIQMRNILSMETTLLQLVKMRPQLQVAHEATYRDMLFMDANDALLRNKRTDSTAVRLFDDYVKAHPADYRFMQRLFKDKSYIRQIDAEDFSDLMFKLAANQQNTLLAQEIDLYDLFSDEEIYGIWQRDNAWWYANYGFWKGNGATQPYSQRRLLRRMIADADSCIQSGATGADLRFGHDEVLLPLVCLLDVNGYGLSTDDLDGLDEKGWVGYRVIPMAANLQLVFYRAGADDRDVVLKVLLNEQEARLPLPSAQYPYYKWSDFRDYYLKKLDAYGK